MGPMGGEVSIKLPFTLMHSPTQPDPTTEEATTATVTAPIMTGNDVDSPSTGGRDSAAEDQPKTDQLHSHQHLQQKAHQTS